MDFLLLQAGRQKQVGKQPKGKAAEGKFPSGRSWKAGSPTSCRGVRTGAV